MLIVLLFAILATLPLSTPAKSVQDEAAPWQDTSPHETRFVTVDEGVHLEVLMWGTSGRPVLLLAGLGNTAHVFDRFAPLLAAEHRVYGITRRGFGASSTPANGYEAIRLADDVLEVIEQLAMENPVIVGHSFAG